MTAHINAKPGDLVPTVIMSDDPLRVRFIAEDYLADYREITNVCNMLGYTGLCFGQPVSVMGHGVGTPSMTLYARELVHDLGVQRTIRIGSLGATQHHVKMRDIILAIATGTGSATSLKRSAGYAMVTSAYFPLLQQAWTLVRKVGVDIRASNVFSGDLYYDPDENSIPALEKSGMLGVGMEIAGLYVSAHRFNIETLAILAVSDHCLIGEETIAEERRLTFNNMIELALNAVVIAWFRLLIEPIRDGII